MALDEIPLELIIYMADFLNPHDLVNFSSTCKTARNLLKPKLKWIARPRVGDIFVASPNLYFPRFVVVTSVRQISIECRPVPLCLSGWGHVWPGTSKEDYFTANKVKYPAHSETQSYTPQIWTKSFLSHSVCDHPVSKLLKCRASIEVDLDWIFKTLDDLKNE